MSRRAVNAAKHELPAAARDRQAAAAPRVESHKAQVERSRSRTSNPERSCSGSASHAELRSGIGRNQGGEQRLPEDSAAIEGHQLPDVSAKSVAPALEESAAFESHQLPDVSAKSVAPALDGGHAAKQSDGLSAAQDLKRIGEPVAGAISEAADAASSGLSTSTTNSSSASADSSTSNSSASSASSDPLGSGGSDHQPDATGPAATALLAISSTQIADAAAAVAAGVEPGERSEAEAAAAPAGGSTDAGMKALQLPAAMTSQAESVSATDAAPTSDAAAAAVTTGSKTALRRLSPDASQPTPAASQATSLPQPDVVHAAASAAAVDGSAVLSLTEGQPFAAPASAITAAPSLVNGAVQDAKPVAAAGRSTELPAADQPPAATSVAADEANRDQPVPSANSIAVQGSEAKPVPSAPAAEEAGPKRKRAPILWNAGRASTASATAPAAKPSAVMASAKAAPPVLPVVKRARTDGRDSSAAALPSAAGTPTAMPAPAQARALREGVSKSNRAPPASAEVQPKSAAAAGIAARSTDVVQGAARADGVALPPAAAHVSGTGVEAAAAGPAGGSKPASRTSVLKRLGPVLAVNPADAAAPTIQDASELLQGGLALEAMVRIFVLIAALPQRGQHVLSCTPWLWTCGAPLGGDDLVAVHNGTWRTISCSFLNRFCARGLQRPAKRQRSGIDDLIPRKARRIDATHYAMQPLPLQTEVSLACCGAVAADVPARDGRLAHQCLARHCHAVICFAAAHVSLQWPTSACMTLTFLAPGAGRQKLPVRPPQQCSKLQAVRRMLGRAPSPAFHLPQLRSRTPARTGAHPALSWAHCTSVCCKTGRLAMVCQRICNGCAQQELGLKRLVVQCLRTKLPCVHDAACSC